MAVHYGVDQDLVHKEIMQEGEWNEHPALRKYYSLEFLSNQVFELMNERNMPALPAIHAVMRGPKHAVACFESLTKNLALTEEEKGNIEHIIFNENLLPEDASRYRDSIVSNIRYSGSFFYDMDRPVEDNFRDELQSIFDDNMLVNLDYLREVCYLQDPKRDVDEHLGTYLFTNDIATKQDSVDPEKAKNFVKALNIYMGETRQAQSILAKGENAKTPEERKAFLVRSMIYHHDAQRRFAHALPSPRHDFREMLPCNDRFGDCLGDRPRNADELQGCYDAVKEGIQTLDALRHHSLNGSLAEKTMGLVYSGIIPSDNPDKSNYDYLNVMAVVELQKQGASDKSIREVAELAMKLNPTIKDAKKYTKYLLIQANNYRSKAAEK